jgi:phosphate transport system substrate-binding protein
MFKTILTCVAMAALAAFPLTLRAEAIQVDKAIPEYKPATGISGSIKSVGSDTLNNVMAGWMEAFKKFYPDVKTEMEGKGTATAPPALIEGTAQLGPMSRTMKATEADEFKKKFGYDPTAIRAAVDALGVFVHKDNPIKELSLDQIRIIFSVEGKENMTWGDLGLTGEWADKPISLYGRNSASGTYGFFKEHAMAKKDFKGAVKEQPGSSAVVQGISADKYGIGYSGIGYVTADVRAVPLSAKNGGKAFAANSENAYAGDYPLSRFLYVYVNIKPGEAPAPIVAEFMKMAVSQQGQQIVVKDGYYPIPKKVVDQELKVLSGSK